MILIDSPPVLDVADTSALTPSVDGILLVLESGVTRPEAAQQALANLQQVGGNVIGAVLNSVPIHTRGFYYYYQEISPSEDNLVGQRRARQSESFPAVRDWFQNQGILPSIRGWFQSKR